MRHRHIGVKHLRGGAQRVRGSHMSGTGRDAENNDALSGYESDRRTKGSWHSTSPGLRKHDDFPARNGLRSYPIIARCIVRFTVTLRM